MKKIFSLISAAAVTVGAVLNVCAEAYTWTGDAGDRKWATADNWSPVGVPTAGAKVTIPSNMNEVVVDEDSSASFAGVRSFTVGAGSTLKGEGAVAPISTLEVASSGMGRIEGFALVESGTVSFSDVNESNETTRISADLSAVTDRAKFANWAICVNGKRTLAYSLQAEAQGFVLSRVTGFTIFFR